MPRLLRKVSNPDLPLREWACIHSQLDWIYDHEVPAAYRDRWIDKSQGGYSAWFLREGRVRVETVSGRTLEAGRGQWLFAPNEPLHQQFSDEARILSLHFLCQWPSGENILSETGGLVVEGKQFPLLEHKAVQLERMVRRHVPGAERQYASRFLDLDTFLAFHTLFLRWLRQWFRVFKSRGAGLSRLAADDDRLLRAVRCLNTAPLSDPLPHALLTQSSGLSAAHLNRLFVTEYGLTIRKSWDNRRLAFARTCLETSRMPVKEIAYNLGFKSDSHFMMWFKKHTGKRPKEYRQTHRSFVRRGVSRSESPAQWAAVQAPSNRSARQVLASSTLRKVTPVGVRTKR